MIDNTDALLTASQVAQRLSCTRQMAHKLIRQGKFPGAFQVGSDWRVPVVDVTAYVTANTVKPLIDTNVEGGEG